MPQKPHGRVVVHPGFPKTGTTTLQHALFARHPQLIRLARPYASPGERARIAPLYQDDLSYEPDMLPNLADLDGVAVFSEEGLSGIPDWNRRVGRGTIARRIHDTWPDAQILFTIRSQLDAIPSLYAKSFSRLWAVPHPHRGRRVSYNAWLEHLLENPDRELSYFDYWPTVDCYRDLFGPAQVTVVPAEWMFRDHIDLFTEILSPLLGIGSGEIAEFISGERHNARPTQRDLVRRRLARFSKLRSLLPPAVKTVLRRWLAGGSPITPSTPPGYELDLASLYRDGNKTLMEKFDLPLDQLGYPT